MKKQAQQTAEKPSRGAFVGTVADNISLGGSYMLMGLAVRGEGAECFGRTRAGQFVQVACRRLDDVRAVAPLLRRPFSIAGIEEDRVEIIYDVVGPGTGWLAHRRVGEQVDMMGPLGKGFTLPEDRQKLVLLIGGGVGLPPLYLLAKELAQAGHRQVIAFAGVRSGDSFPGTVDRGKYDGAEPLAPQMVIDELRRYDTPVVLATDDGSVGWAGNVVQAAEAWLKTHGDKTGAQVYACGPKVMLKAAAQLAGREGFGCQVCMEEYMACGIGVCQSCVVETRSESDGERRYELTCTKGPVFDARSVIW